MGKVYTKQVSWMLEFFFFFFVKPWMLESRPMKITKEETGKPSNYCLLVMNSDRFISINTPSLHKKDRNISYTYH